MSCSPPSANCRHPRTPERNTVVPIPRRRQRRGERRRRLLVRRLPRLRPSTSQRRKPLDAHTRHINSTLQCKTSPSYTRHAHSIPCDESAGTRVHKKRATYSWCHVRRMSEHRPHETSPPHRHPLGLFTRRTRTMDKVRRRRRPTTRISLRHFGLSPLADRARDATATTTTRLR